MPGIRHLKLLSYSQTSTATHSAVTSRLSDTAESQLWKLKLLIASISSVPGFMNIQDWTTPSSQSHLLMPASVLIIVYMEMEKHSLPWMHHHPRKTHAHLLP